MSVEKSRIEEALPLLPTKLAELLDKIEVVYT